jgi:alanine racemase
MPLTLYVDGPRWRAHQRQVRDAHPGIVPVVKGNGYGLGIARLAEEAERLGVDTVAVGMYQEVAPVQAAFSGSVVVLTPWRPFEPAPASDPRVVHTVGRLEDLASLVAQGGRPRVVLERLTSMRRHGLSAADLRTSAGMLAGVELEGVSIHLPIGRGSHLAEVDRLLTDVVAADLPTRRVYLSHLTDSELATLARSWPDLELRLRVGTALWLGDRHALDVRATVLDAHPVARGDGFGYRGRSAPVAGTIVMVSGGTAHGIALEAPSGGATLRTRLTRVALGGLDAAGFVRSPYTLDGAQRLFAEPPHMQASMLFVTRGVRVPEVGTEVPVRVRFTTTSFDETVVSEDPR